jgi:tRNA nucleotidyltransferase (CCA-adding enzyme)
MGGAAFDTAAVLAALERYPRLPVAVERIAVVGGFVRDVQLGREPRELDLIVEGEVEPIARSLGGDVVVHEPFGTASVSAPGWRIDLAMARRERYAAPGSLPEVEPARIEEDLARRDFTVNALAVTLPAGELLAADRALEDLEQRTLRVLHERSFVDDPTRVLRLARYAERLGFEVEPITAALAANASMATLSGARLGGELRLVLTEPDPIAVLERLTNSLSIDVERPVLEAALALAPPESDRAMLVLGAVAREETWLGELELTVHEREVALACHRAAAPVDRSPTGLWRAWSRVPVEAVAVAGARGALSAAQEWIGELRHIRLEIGGDDLIAAGLAQGPQIGSRLEQTLLARLDGEIARGRESELAYALSLANG